MSPAFLLPMHVVNNVVMFNIPTYQYLGELKSRIKDGTWGLGFGHCFACANNLKRCRKCRALIRDAEMAEIERAKYFNVERLDGGFFLTFD